MIAMKTLCVLCDLFYLNGGISCSLLLYSCTQTRRSVLIRLVTTYEPYPYRRRA